MVSGLCCGLVLDRFDPVEVRQLIVARGSVKKWECFFFLYVIPTEFLTKYLFIRCLNLETFSKIIVSADRCLLSCSTRDRQKVSLLLI